MSSKISVDRAGDRPDRPSEPDLLARLGWGEDLAAAYARHDRPEDLVGRVHRVDRGRLYVLTAGGPLVVDDHLPAPADPGEAVCTGDWVILRSPPTAGGAERPAAVAALPRRTALRRASPGGDSRGQALAANVDGVALVEGLVPLPDLTRMERMLVLLWESGAAPLVVLTKADLIADAAELAADVAAIAPGVPVLPVSSPTGDGLAALAPYVAAGRTLALLGRSGAGKSTLVNRLAGGETLQTRQVRADGKGRHTTVRRELLLAADGGGALIDTPGLRGAGLWAADEGVGQVFADIEALAARCRFADCSHEAEPGCAIAAALAEGTLGVRRWASYRKLQREAAWIAARTDARLRAERSRAWRRVTLQQRRSGRSRP